MLGQVTLFSRRKLWVGGKGFSCQFSQSFAICASILKIMNLDYTPYCLLKNKENRLLSLGKQSDAKTDEKYISFHYLVYIEN